MAVKPAPASGQWSATPGLCVCRELPARPVLLGHAPRQNLPHLPAPSPPLPGSWSTSRSTAAQARPTVVLARLKRYPLHPRLPPTPACSGGVPAEQGCHPAAAGAWHQRRGAQPPAAKPLQAAAGGTVRVAAPAASAGSFRGIATVKLRCHKGGKAAPAASGGAAICAWKFDFRQSLATEIAGPALVPSPPCSPFSAFRSCIAICCQSCHEEVGKLGLDPSSAPASSRCTQLSGSATEAQGQQIWGCISPLGRWSHC